MEIIKLPAVSSSYQGIGMLVDAGWRWLGNKHTKFKKCHARRMFKKNTTTTTWTREPRKPAPWVTPSQATAPSTSTTAETRGIKSQFARVPWTRPQHPWQGAGEHCTRGFRVIKWPMVSAHVGLRCVRSSNFRVQNLVVLGLSWTQCTHYMIRPSM